MSAAVRSHPINSKTMTPHSNSAKQPGKFPDGVVARIVPSPSPRAETPEHVFHRDPRISATKLGEFLVADESRKLTIVKDCKKAKKAVVLHYTKTRHGFSDAFGPDGFDPQAMVQRAIALRGSAGGTDWDIADTKMSAAALDEIATIADRLPLQGAQRIARPAGGWGGVDIEGVRVSVNPDVVFCLPHRGVMKVGAALLYTTKDPTKALSRELGDNKAGDYVAALLLRLLELKLASSGVPYPAKCFVIDVHRREIYTPPTRFKTALKHIEAACHGIASRWDKIETSFPGHAPEIPELDLGHPAGEEAGLDED